MIDVYPHQLSGGQRQRIMIAAALVLDPVLLIADEPTTALDVTTQAQILKLIKELRERRNTGVLFITHDFGVVAEVAHRVVVMQHGRVVEQGRTERRAAPAARRLHAHADPLGAEPLAARARTDHRRADRAADERPEQDLRVGRLLREAPRGEGREGREPAGPTRRDARRGRRVRLRQIDRGALHRAADRADRRRDPDRRRRRRKARGPRAAAAPQARADRVPGSLSFAQSAPHRRRRDHRGTDELRHGRARGDRRAPAT